MPSISFLSIPLCILFIASILSYSFSFYREPSYRELYDLDHLTLQIHHFFFSALLQVVVAA